MADRVCALVVCCLTGLGAAAERSPALAQTPEATPEVTVEERAPLGARAAIRAVDAKVLSLAPGTPIYSQPDARSHIVRRVDVATDAALMSSGAGTERPTESEWRKVSVGSLVGWVAPAGHQPLSGPESLRAAPLEHIDLEEARWQALEARFGDGAPFGGSWLFSDPQPEERGELERLERVVGRYAEAYTKRYGLPAREGERPIGIAIFSAEDEYRRFVRDELGLDDPGAAGVSPPGLAVLFSGQRHYQQMAAVLVHELTHVFNRRNFGEALPAWLEEGLAEDMAFHEIAPTGELLLGTVPKIERSAVQRIDREGRTVVLSRRFTPPPRFAIACAAAAWPKAGPDLDRLSQLSGDDFAELSGRRQRYTDSALLVRYLLDGADDQVAAKFLVLLERVSEVRYLDYGMLLEELELSSEQLKRGVATWTKKLVNPNLCRR